MRATCGRPWETLCNPACPPHGPHTACTLRKCDARDAQTFMFWLIRCHPCECVLCGAQDSLSRAAPGSPKAGQPCSKRGRPDTPELPAPCGSVSVSRADTENLGGGRTWNTETLVPLLGALTCAVSELRPGHTLRNHTRVNRGVWWRPAGTVQTSLRGSIRGPA